MSLVVRQEQPKAQGTKLGRKMLGLKEFGRVERGKKTL